MQPHHIDETVVSYSTTCNDNDPTAYLRQNREAGLHSLTDCTDKLVGYLIVDEVEVRHSISGSEEA